MNKKDLKTGMIVELTNHSRYLVVEKTMISKFGQMFLDNYNENLTLKNKSFEDKYDIIKVYTKSTGTWGAGFEKGLHDDCDLTVIWDRNDTIEMTIEEIADKLGIPSNNLRIKS